MICLLFYLRNNALCLIQLSKYEIKIQMDFNVIDSVINAVLFAQEKQFQVLDF
jgi:hypothetical protein